MVITAILPRSRALLGVGSNSRQLSSKKSPVPQGERQYRGKPKGHGKPSKFETCTLGVDVCAHRGPNVAPRVCVQVQTVAWATPPTTPSLFLPWPPHLCKLQGSPGSTLPARPRTQTKPAVCSKGEGRDAVRRSRRSPLRPLNPWKDAAEAAAHGLRAPVGRAAAQRCPAAGDCRGAARCRGTRGPPPAPAGQGVLAVCCRRRRGRGVVGAGRAHACALPLRGRRVHPVRGAAGKREERRCVASSGNDVFEQWAPSALLEICLELRSMCRHGAGMAGMEVARPANAAGRAWGQVLPGRVPPLRR